MVVSKKASQGRKSPKSTARKTMAKKPVSKGSTTKKSAAKKASPKRSASTKKVAPKSSPRKTPKKSYYFLEKGRITGYEPSAMKGVRIPGGRLVHGVPGKGLATARFSKKSRKIGTEGEKLFARALKIDGYTDKVDTFWSVKVPDPKLLEKTAKSKADIDSIFLFGDIMVLVDVKYYFSGKGTWEILRGGESIGFRDDSNGNRVGAARKMSPNMGNATAIMKRRFPEYKVYSYVVFMPTDRGEAHLKDVSWPGGIRAMYYSMFKRVLTRLINSESMRLSGKIRPKRSTVAYLESLLS